MYKTNVYEVLSSWSISINTDQKNDSKIDKKINKHIVQMKT